MALEGPADPIPDRFPVQPYFSTEGDFMSKDTSRPQIPASPRGPAARPPVVDGKSFRPTITVIPNTTSPDRPKGVNPNGKGVR